MVRFLKKKKKRIDEALFGFLHRIVERSSPSPKPIREAVDEASSDVDVHGGTMCTID